MMQLLNYVIRAVFSFVCNWQVIYSVFSLQFCCSSHFQNLGLQSSPKARKVTLQLGFDPT